MVSVYGGGTRVLLAGGLTEAEGTPIFATIGKPLYIAGSRPFFAAALGSPKFLSITSHLCSVSKPNKFSGSPGWTLWNNLLVGI